MCCSLISNNWGGTPVEHWSSPDALHVCNANPDSTLWNAMVVPYTIGPMASEWQGGAARRRASATHILTRKACATPGTLVYPSRSPHCNLVSRGGSFPPHTFAGALCDSTRHTAGIHLCGNSH